MMKLTGSGVVPGVVYAPAVWVAQRPALPEIPTNPTDLLGEPHRPAELERFLNAADKVASLLHDRAETTTGVAAEVLKADAAMAEDRGWRKAARKQILAGVNAQAATVAASQRFIDLFAQAGGVMAERITDLEDVRDRVLAVLTGAPQPGLPTTTEPSVVLAEDLSPADTALLDASQYKGIVLAGGGPTSHTAIVARQLNIPCIVAVGSHLHDIAEATPVLVDGARGSISTGVAAKEAQRAVSEYDTLAQAIASWEGPGRLADGTPVALLANVSDSASARAAAGSWAEGIGLYRTEMAFLRSRTEPTVEDQAGVYRKVFEAFPERKVVIRTLDAGSDKPISYATGDYNEDNPALGVRGIRVAFDHKEELLSHQLDAIALAAKDRTRVPTWVMAPMVSTPHEVERFAKECRTRDLTPGVMIEVPAAALLAEQIMAHVDFVSIGTNDLTQYTMAADRLSPRLTNLNSPWQPAVLNLIKKVCEDGIRTGTSVGVCGEAAADPLMACVLVGLGVSSLSCASTAIPGVGAQLAAVTHEDCRRAAHAACNAFCAQEGCRRVAEMISLS